MYLWRAQLGEGTGALLLHASIYVDITSVLKFFVLYYLANCLVVFNIPERI